MKKFLKKFKIIKYTLLFYKKFKFRNYFIKKQIINAKISDKIVSYKNFNLKKRNIKFKKKIKIILVFPDISWHNLLLNDFNIIADCFHFDYTKLGVTEEDLINPKKRIASREYISKKLYEYIKKITSNNKIDFIFFYYRGLEIKVDYLNKINKLKIPTINMCLDDKNSWEVDYYDNQYSGQKSICSYFHYYWTSSSTTYYWLKNNSVNAIFLPEGFSSHIYKPLSIRKEYDVVFVGSNYGFRENFINKLKKMGLKIRCFGSGWDKKLNTDEEINLIFNKSKIVLGMGGIGYNEEIMNLKGRDFDAPGSGAALYITSFNPDLALFFDIGKEILCYRNEIDLFDQINHYLQHYDEAEKIILAGRLKSLNYHRWVHRFAQIYDIINADK